MIPEEIDSTIHFEDEEAQDLFILQRMGFNLGLELYLVRNDGVILKGWRRLHKRENILMEGINNKEIKEIILIVPQLEMLVLSNGRQVEGRFQE